MQTQLEIAYNLKYINEIQFNKTNEESKEIERMLSSFIRKIKERVLFFDKNLTFEPLQLTDFEPKKTNDKPI
jgi:hypothetical protein